MNRRLGLLSIIALLLCSVHALAADNLERGFLSPPDSARPWVYWFWLNGNITREGITTDLEAMKRVGIGGVLIMEVDQGAPVGPVDFMGTQWRELFTHVVSEAHRLGLEVNMNNDAGWNGSGGPWIRPEQSMQKVVWTEVEVEGPRRFEDTLKQPETVAGYYRDISVLAFPSPGPYRIPGIQGKAAFTIGSPGPAGDALPPEMLIAQDRIVDISARMDTSGRLIWDVPQGRWTIVRFGHTSTGAENAPAPATGRGLECDKLSKEGAEANFSGMMAKLVADNGPLTGKSLVATHVDSWENGSQNWTAKMREEFRARRGYDMLPYLPVMTGRVVGSLEISERFLWDLRRTISELVVENYAGHIRKLAHEHGLRFTIEAYGSPCDNIPYGGQADEPMGEFWSPSGAMETCKGMACAAHVYGNKIVGAEAFTAGDQERWREHPAAIKALGDRAFCEGINRFVFHRYALQPWVEGRNPGMTMGPWGQHYERTQTWWELTPGWHQYLSRCQYLLRQGLFVADICYLQPEAPPHALASHDRFGYDWDECGSEVVLSRMSVKDGRIVLPDGMSYSVLVLPNSPTMTPALLRKIRGLVEAGATVIGPRPIKSPSLSDYPKCDDEVRRLGEDLWGDCDGVKVKERRFGKGRVICGIPPEKVLAQSNVAPDFISGQPLRYIHRSDDGAQIYFVSNQKPYAVTTTATFRVSGMVPELWWPDTGRIEPAAIYDEKNGRTSVALSLDPSGSVFVVFRKHGAEPERVVAVQRDGKTLLSSVEEPPVKITVVRALYGVLDDPARTRDVRERVQHRADNGEYSFAVSAMAEGDDPAVNVVKTLVVDYLVDGKSFSVRARDPETINLASDSGKLTSPCEVTAERGRVRFSAREAGRYTLVSASGKKTQVDVAAIPPPLTVDGSWKVTFPRGSGAPESIMLDRLISLSEHSDPGVRYFAGTATYRATMDIPRELLARGRSLRLDLGEVQVMARVKLNGKDLGLLWKPPYAFDVTGMLKPGANDLEVAVTNLWPNRLIGDEQLPDDSDRNPNGTLKSWPQWLLDGKPSPTGRFTFTSWRLWHKGDALLRSGPIGPVRIEAAFERDL